MSNIELTNADDDFPKRPSGGDTAWVVPVIATTVLTTAVGAVLVLNRERIASLNLDWSGLNVTFNPN